MFNCNKSIIKLRWDIYEVGKVLRVKKVKSLSYRKFKA